MAAGTADHDKMFFDILDIVGISILGVVVFAQIIATIIYFWKSRKIKEITWLSKLIMVMAIMAGILVFAAWVGGIFGLATSVQGLFLSINKILKLVCYGITFRFNRI